MPSRRRSQPVREPVTGSNPGRMSTGRTVRAQADNPAVTRRQPTSRPSRPARDYLPTTAGKQTANATSVLEVEYIGGILLLFLTIFTDQNSEYGDKMLAFMKRATLTSILFFILALLAQSSEGAAKFAKVFGGLVIGTMFLSTAGQNTISALDAFFKADWTSGNNVSGNTSANATAGQQTNVGTPFGNPNSIINNTVGAAQVPGNVVSETIDGAKYVVKLPVTISTKLKQWLGFLCRIQVG